MHSKITKSLSPLMVFPSFLAARAKTNEMLIEQCGQLCSIKDYKSVKAITPLIDSPVARLYEAISENDYSSPEIFITESLPDKYKCRAFLCAAISCRVRGDLQAAERFLFEACRTAKKHNDLATFYQSQRELAIVSASDGNDKGALVMFETIFPLAKILYRVRPTLYFDNFNCRAVALTDLGRLQEAGQFCSVALASPYLFAYPEAFQTRLEIKKKARRASHSRVVVPELPVENKVLDLVSYKVDRPLNYTISSGSADVLDFESRMAEMKKNQQKKEQQKQLSKGDKIAEIVKLLYRADEKEIDATLDRLNKYQTEHTKKP